MIKIKISLLCFLTLGVVGVRAQNATTAAGGDASGAGGSSSYSVGQAAYNYSSSTAGSVNQGVQQPYELLTVGVNNHPDINLLMSVFPNPSVSSINLNVGKQDLQNLSFQLFDVQGKLLMSQKITNSDTSIKMEDFNAGNYFLKIIDSQSELKTFNIIKN